MDKHLSISWEKSLQDHTALQHEQQSKKTALGQLRDLVAGCLVGQGWGEVSRAECRRCLERGMHA